MKIKFGYRELEFPSAEIGELRESDLATDSLVVLKQRMADDGYLFMRGLIDREKVMAARQTVLAYMESQQALTPDTPLLEGVMPAGGRTVQMMGRKGIAHHADVQTVIENDNLFSFFSTFFEEDALTFHYKWLRAVGNEEYTGAHMDFVYMGQGSPNLHTVWIPFGDISVEHGTLAMCVGSHSLSSFARIRETYGRMDVDRDGIEGWFSRDPMEIVEKYGGQWLTANFQAGDVMIFGMHTMHASTTNLTNRYRLSCDVRYQPVSDPADKRWRKDGVWDKNLNEPRSMQDARDQWGV